MEIFNLTMHEKALEAILFLSGEPLTIKEVGRHLGIDKKATEVALEALEISLKNRGLALLCHNDEISLVTRPEVSDVVSNLAKEKLEGELSRSALEVLAIVLWKGIVSRSSIDFIRGVNSTFSLRALLLRGLIERASDPKDARIYLYRPTVDLFKYLGITSHKELPDWQKIVSEIDTHAE